MVFDQCAFIHPTLYILAQHPLSPEIISLSVANYPLSLSFNQMHPSHSTWQHFHDDYQRIYTMLSCTIGKRERAQCNFGKNSSLIQREKGLRYLDCKREKGIKIDLCVCLLCRRGTSKVPMPTSSHLISFLLAQLLLSFEEMKLPGTGTHEYSPTSQSFMGDIDNDLHHHSRAKSLWPRVNFWGTK